MEEGCLTAIEYATCTGTLRSTATGLTISRGHDRTDQ